jgi:RNA polymerase sigma-70 factor (ECF subfamily)
VLGLLNDEGLADALTAAVAGGEAGFGALWRSLNPALLRYLRVVAGDAADDVASETWLQAVRDLGRFSGDAAAFRVWLFRIGRNRAIDHRRRAARRLEDLDGTPGAYDASGAPDAAAEAIERSDTDWALRLIASLPPDQADAVMLRVVAGLDVAQTAQVLGKRPGAVRVAAMRGLRRLARDAEVQGRRQIRAAVRPEIRGSARVAEPPRLGGAEGV